MLDPELTDLAKLKDALPCKNSHMTLNRNLARPLQPMPRLGSHSQTS